MGLIIAGLQQYADFLMPMMYLQALSAKKYPTLEDKRKKLQS